ncbi:alpha/beta hydrolase [Arthrobacter sp. YAF34]|uniref:alpha/beta hydrolase n=1 Tax=Arthrobacter sp. YAF34 TaxID=3233083 RepID=UPI003F912803
MKSAHLTAPPLASQGLDSGSVEATGLKRGVLKWSGAVVAAALIVVPLWMLLSNPAVLGGHPALPILLLAAVASGLAWALVLARHWNLTKDRNPLHHGQQADGISPAQRHTGDAPSSQRHRSNRTRGSVTSRFKWRRGNDQHSGVSRWKFARGIAGRLFVLGFVAVLVWLNPFPYQPGNTAASASTSSVTTTEDATSITLAPEGKATTGLVFYPGAKVDAHAYQDVLRPLAAAGHLVVILKVPLGIPLLETDQARAAMDRHPEIGSWAVGGHSLGGVSASAFVASNPDVSGLLLFASYPAENMADAQGLSVLSISGSNDGLSTPDKIAASKPLLPPTTRYATVVGGVHAFFGDYGEQPGDGEPGISREDAQQQIVTESLRFMDQLQVAG